MTSDFALTFASVRAVVWSAVLGSIALSGAAVSAPAAPAPLASEWRSFEYDGKRAVQADFETTELSYTFDIRREWTTASATIRFTTHATGSPFYLMKGSLGRVTLNGQPVRILNLKPPGSSSWFEVVDATVQAGSRNELKIEFRPPGTSVTYRDATVGFLTAMADLQYGRFFEPYGPSSFEDDAHRVTMDIQVINAFSRHHVFANGTVTELGQNRWRVEYPPYLNSNALYLHVNGTPMTVVHGKYRGLEREIPYTIYSKRSSEAKEGARLMPRLFAELERDYGPYLHPSFVAYISGGGGMEHAGAAITSIGALDHELLHSWFARGVMPSDGRSGWIDEGIAAWRDGHYFRSSWPPHRSEVNLAVFSPLERFTPKNCYRDGSQLMSELDAHLASRGGLKPVLKRFFAQFKAQNITTPIFQAFLETELGIDLDAVFKRYVYGDRTVSAEAGAPVSTHAAASLVSRHPPALTQAEIEALR